jgi:hypothetical protein
MVRETGSTGYQAMVERSNWKRPTTVIKRNAGSPTMKVTVEEGLSAFEPNTGDSNACSYCEVFAAKF